MKIKMKNWFSLFVIIALVVVIAACSDTNDTEPTADDTEEVSEEVNANVEEDAGAEDNSSYATYDEGLAIYTDQLNTLPTMKDIVDVFTMLEMMIFYEEDIEEGLLVTYEWLGEEELGGTVVDKISLVSTDEGDSVFGLGYINAEMWIDQEGTVLKIHQVYDDGEEVIHTIEEDEAMEYTVDEYTAEFLQPFTYFHDHVRRFISYESIKVEEHATSSTTLFDETVETHDVRLVDNGGGDYEYIEATVAYYGTLEVLLYTEMETGYGDGYYELEVLDYELR